MYAVLFHLFLSLSPSNALAAHQDANNAAGMIDGTSITIFDPATAAAINNALIDAEMHRENMRFAMAYEAYASEDDYSEYLTILDAA